MSANTEEVARAVGEGEEERARRWGERIGRLR
jgi:hypothetical protein